MQVLAPWAELWHGSRLIYAVNPDLKNNRIRHKKKSKTTNDSQKSELQTRLAKEGEQARSMLDPILRIGTSFYQRRCLNAVIWGLQAMPLQYLYVRKGKDNPI